MAVDGTIHYLTWFGRGRADGLSRPRAVHFALDHCARPMMQSTLVCGLGLLVFVLSEFIPTRQFAWMIAALMGVALIGDLFLLPALLNSPLGAVFRRRSLESPRVDSPAPVEMAQDRRAS
jgi:predicted RND superfamily exporter protein